MSTFSIQTFGCRVNQAEAFLWTDTFQRHGLKYEKDFTRSDLVIVNSCTLTRRADSDVRRFIRRISRKNPKARLLVTGCYADRMPEELKNMPQVCGVFSNAEKDDLRRRVLSLAPGRREMPVMPFRSRALVKIQDGCNFHCAFCVIPRVRGKSISLEKKGILNQIREFVRQGFREIVLTGIHLCSYGLDLKPRRSLLELLDEIESLEELVRVRLSSLDPRFLKPSWIEHLTRSRKICPHFHLSLQHGSDGILKRMGRDIKIEDYRKILARLRQNSPPASLGADIIVGFPGETEEDFKKTYSFLKQSPLSYFHVFTYSPRPGTAAASWPQGDGRVKRERAALLRNLSQKKNGKFRRHFLGKECEGIVVMREKNRNRVLTSNYLEVFVPPCSCRERENVKVKITRVGAGETRGLIVE